MIFQEGDTVRTIIKEVKFNNSNTLVLSFHVHPQTLARLFEQEVAEILKVLSPLRKSSEYPVKELKLHRVI